MGKTYHAILSDTREEADERVGKLGLYVFSVERTDEDDKALREDARVEARKRNIALVHNLDD